MNYRRIDQIRIAVMAVILVASGVMFVALPVLAVRWVQAPYPGLLFDPNLVVNKSTPQIDPVNPDTPEITYPDRATAVNGRAFPTTPSLHSYLATLQPGDVVTFTFDQPPASSVIEPRGSDTAVRSVDLVLSHMDEATFWSQFWLFYLVGVVIFLFGVLTFLARPDAEAAQVFALFAVSTAVIIGALFDQVTTQVFIRVWTLALSVAGGFTLLLAFVFPHEARLIARFPWLKWIIILPGLLLAAWGEIWLYHGPDAWAYALPWRYAYFWNALTLIATLGFMVYRSIASPSALVRQQARIILLGAVAGLMPILVTLLWLATSQGWERFNPSVFLPPVLLFPLAIAYTIIRYRLLDVNKVVRRGLTYLLMTVILVGAFLLIISGLAMSIGVTITFSNPLVVAIAMLAVFVIYDPLQAWLQKWLDRLLFQKPVEFSELLRQYNRRLTTAVNADQVADALLEYAQIGIPVANPQLFLPDNDLGGYSSYPNTESALINADSPLVAYMQQFSEVLDLAVERAWPAELREHPEDIHLQQAVVIVPLNNEQQLLGWLSLPAKQNGQPYSQSELNYLGALADQSLIGLERATVMRRLEARVAELDQLSQFSQALNFTIDPDVLLELVFTNYQRLLQIDNFFIALIDGPTQRLYAAFVVEQGERLPEREGRDVPVENPHIQQVLQTGQMADVVDENGRTWWIAPLNAGAETLGVLYTFFADETQIRPRQKQLFNVFADRTAVALDRLQTRQELADRAQQLEIINEVTLSLASTLELEPLLNLIMDKAMELLDTEAGTFMMTVEDTGELEFRVVRGPASNELVGRRLPIGTGLAGTAAQTGRPVRQNRVQDDKRWFGDIDPHARFVSESILTVPLLRGNTVLGVVQVINKRNGAPFNAEDETLLAAFAGQAVVALENARLLEQTDLALQERVSELFMLQQLDRDLNTTLDLEHVLNLTLDWALRVSDGRAGTIVLTNEESKPYLQAQRGYDHGFSIEPVNGTFADDGLISRVLASSEPHVTGNVHAEPDYKAISFETLSQITLPIIHKQKLIGVAAIESDRMNTFNNGHLETAVRMTNHAAVAIANALLYQQVKEANQAKSEFVSMVSHELKTPMTSMRGYTDLLLSGMTGDLSNQQRSFLETIAANIRRMSQQIQDLTDISRIETGQLHMDPAPTAFTIIVSETLQTVRGLCDAKGIELHLELPDELPSILADKERLVQVLTNLISNACKYSPNDTDIYVKLWADSMSLDSQVEATPVVICAVQDTGYGISAEDQKRLFTKFFRADDPNIRKATGTGLGLSITRGIVELHGGKIWVESELNKGTTFTFAVPQAQG
ncbi:MAG: GAF domain-containing protein [Ardenticatenaceae bacterium]|nr:GAF domain-containing protein [Ardenticatenaceae bacterium]